MERGLEYNRVTPLIGVKLIGLLDDADPAVRAGAVRLLVGGRYTPADEALRRYAERHGGDDPRPARQARLYLQGRVVEEHLRRLDPDSMAVVTRAVVASRYGGTSLDYTVDGRGSLEERVNSFDPATTARITAHLKRLDPSVFRIRPFRFRVSARLREQGDKESGVRLAVEDYPD